MRRLVDRSRSLGRSRLNVEELECRAQPAVFGLSISFQAFAGLYATFGTSAEAFTSTSA
jgi:hypothetical protein